MSETTPESNKARLLKGFDLLFNQRNYEAARQYCELHSAQRSYPSRKRRTLQSCERIACRNEV
jgi:hypothetical protein